MKKKNGMMSLEKSTEHLQLIVVSTRNWASFQGTLMCLERKTTHSKWHCVRKNIPIVVGKNGMTWVDQKKEGDGKSPVGLFPLKEAFGISKNRSLKLPFITLRPSTEAIDDPNSKFYNQIVDANDVQQKDWKSSEKMLSYKHLYAQGIVIEHNKDPVIPYRGSCIFMHNWTSPNQGTAGCTAMSSEDLEFILTWLDPSLNPALLQLPI